MPKTNTHLDKATPKSSAAFVNTAINKRNISKYFKQMRIRLITGLMVIFILPHALFTLYFHIQFTSSLKKADMLNLAALSESQRNTIDLFLQERVVNLFALFYSREFRIQPSDREMANYLRYLRQVSDAFVDVGFLDSKGIQIGYAGPFPYLQGKDYSGEKWFTTLMNQEKGYFISDIYQGFRNKPHFTIATKQIIDGQAFTMRSTLDPDKFYMFLRTISHGKGIESALVNENGLYQVVDPDRGELLGMSKFVPSMSQKSNVLEIKEAGDQVLVAYTWLKETNWALLVWQPLVIAHAQMYRARKIMMVSFIVLLCVISGGIWVLTRQLVNYAQASTEKSRELQSQLVHASKLASIGELATGVAHEINNPLAIITSTSGVIRDLLDPEFELDASPENILKEVDIIESAAFRASKITRQLLDFGHEYQPSLVMCDVHSILDDVINGLKAREFKVEDIEIRRKYKANLPKVLLDSDQIRQVFLNIINNAGDAISGPGTITLSTAVKDDNVLVTIKDTGRGMTSEQMEKIFDPFYTTKEVGKGTGLGLSVSLSIVESMGGSITVQSLPEEGSSFTVSLPIKRKNNQA
jgi:two-component system NtrC family sensor kinase